MGIISNIESFRGLDLSSDDYEAFLDATDNFNLGVSVSSKPLKRGLSAPMQGALVRDGDTMTVTIIVKTDSQAVMDALLIAFDETNKELGEVVGTEDGSAAQWAVMGRPIKPLAYRNGAFKSVLEVPDRIWTNKTPVTDSATITASGQTFDIAIGGNAKAQPIFEIIPIHARGAGGYDYREYLAIVNPGSKNFVNTPFLFKTLNTSALVGAGKMQSSGDDLQLMREGAFVSRWLTAMNTTATKINGNISLKPRIQMTLSGAMAGSGAVTIITLKANPANKTALAKLPTKGKVLIKTGANVEIFTYTSRVPASYQIKGVQRAQRFTSMAAHSDGDAVVFLEYDYYLVYGLATATALDVLDDGMQPLITAATSDNGTWSQALFATEDGLRTGGWSRAPVETLGKNNALSNVYTAALGTTADPATAMGGMIKAYNVANSWKAETAETQWEIFVPSGITNVLITGQKQRSSTSWPVGKLEKSIDGKTWFTVWTEATPASPNTPTALATHNDALSGTYYYLRFSFSGQMAKEASNAAYMEISAVTLTLDAAAGAPVVTFDSGEQSSYPMDAALENVTTGDVIILKGISKLLDVLTIDCAAREIYTQDGRPAWDFISWNTSREAWMDCKPNATNQFKYTEVGVDEVDINTSVAERRKA